MKIRRNRWIRSVLMAWLILVLAIPFALEISFLLPGSMSVVQGAETESIQIESTLGAGSLHALNLAETTTYNLTIDITAQSLDQPKLVIEIPQGINLTYYPGQSDATLAPLLASISNPVTRTTGSDQTTILTYQFKSNIAAVGFNITLNPTYNLKPDNSYTVYATLCNGEASQASADDTISITNNPTLNLGAYYLETYPYVQDVVLNDDVDAYIARIYGYIYPNYVKPYDYDEMEIVLPLPDDAVPGYYDGDSFALLAEDTPKSFTNGSVTYQTNYDIRSINGSELATGQKVLVYTLTKDHPLVRSDYIGYYYFYDQQMGSIHLQFPGTMSTGDQSAVGSARIGVRIDGDTDNLLVLRDYSLNSPLRYHFKEYNIGDFLNQTMYTSSMKAYTGNTLLNIMDNSYFYNAVTNNTGERIEDLRIEYVISPELHCYRLDFNLTADANNRLPTTATVQYRTKLDDTLRTATLTADDAQLILPDESDSFTFLDVVYDKLESYEYSNILLQGYLTNWNNEDSGSTFYRFSSQIRSAVPTGSLSDIPIGEQTATSGILYLRQKHNTTAPYDYYLSSNVLSKGDAFHVRFRLTQNSAFVTNPTIYMMMPSEYIFSRYTSPYPEAGYEMMQRQINVDDIQATADVPAGRYTLYTVKYNDNVEYNAYNSNHYMYFTVGPEVDTATLRTNVLLPSAFGLDSENSRFPYRIDEVNYRIQDHWDFDQDGNTTEYFASPYQKSRVTINAVRSIFAQSYVTSSFQSAGESSSQSYQHNSTGTYKLYINNGLDSGNKATDSTINITIPKAGYPSANYSSQWDVQLTDEPILSGGFLTGANVIYSTDGGLNYQDTVADYSEVTNVRIETQEGQYLQSSENIKVELPFKVSFPQTGINSSSKAYFEADFSYYLNDSTTPTTTNLNVNTLSTAAVPISGAIFRDYDTDGIQDDNERNNNKNYQVFLYQGSYTSGTSGLESLGQVYTNYYTGVYNFTNVYLPGTYTLRVIKGNDEYFPASGLFTQDGESNDAYYSFTLDASDVSANNINLGIISPRTLQLNMSNITIFEGGLVRKIVPTINPQLSDSETVTCHSSDDSVVAVASDGTLSYVSDGTAIITVSVPQVASLTDLLGDEPVSATVTVTARKSSYAVIYKDHEGHDLSGLLPAGYAESMNYTYGYTTYLPTAAPYERNGYTFSGWYSAATGGTKINYVFSTQYGDQTVYARWNANQYSISYQGMSGANFGTYHPTTYSYDSDSLVSDPTRPGYLFDGWTINDSSTTEKSLTLSAQAYTADIVLKANWTLEEPSVNLTADDSDHSVIFGTDITITANASHPINPTFSYTWYRQETEVEDLIMGTGRTLMLSDVSDSGTYYCVVSMSDGTDEVRKTSETITVSIIKASGSITNVSDISKIYDGTVVEEPDFQKAGTGTATISYKNSGEPDSAFQNSRPSAAGEYVVKILVSEDANHHQTMTTAGFTISPRAITVSPIDDLEKTYGDPDPELVYSIVDGSLVEGDSFSGFLNRASGEDVGVYDISLGSLTLGNNYTLNLTAGTLAITPKEISITADAQNKTYGDPDPELAYSIIDGSLVEGDSFGGSLDRETGETVGDYAIGQGDLTLGDNYTIHYSGSVLTINPRPLTIKAVDQVKNFGDDDPAFTVQYINLAPFDAPDDITGLEIGRTPGTSVGRYEIFPSGVVSENYTITYDTAILTVNPKQIVITADAQNKVYGQQDPSLTYVLPTGSLEQNDALSGQLVRESGENVGVYRILQGSLTAGNNYQIIFKEANFVITEYIQEKSRGRVRNGFDNQSGDVISFIAEPQSGYGFAYWSDGRTLFSTRQILLNPGIDISQFQPIFWPQTETTDQKTVQLNANQKTDVSFQKGGVRMILPAHMDPEAVLSVTNFHHASDYGAPENMYDASLFYRLLRSENLNDTTIRLEISLDQAGRNLGNIDRSRLQLFRWNEDDQAWEQAHILAQGVDEESGILWADVQNFSTYGVFYPADAVEIPGTGETFTRLGLLFAIISLFVLIVIKRKKYRDESGYER